MSQLTNNDTSNDTPAAPVSAEGEQDEVEKFLEKVDEMPPDLISAERRQELSKKIRAKVDEIRNYTPKIGVFGDSGVGKSSLCNALFGQDAAKVNDVEACTREPQEILLQSENGGMILMDVPGIGEDPTHQKEYTALYMSLASKLDLILWAIKADSRSYASAIESFHAVYPKGKPQEPPLLFVITQTDKTNDSDDWDREAYKPGGSQIGNIAIKENDVSRRFDLKAGQIISVAASPKGKTYNLTELVDLVVEALPNDKKSSFTRVAKQKNVSKKARKSAEKGLWDSIKELGSDLLEVITPSWWPF